MSEVGGVDSDDICLMYETFVVEWATLDPPPKKLPSTPLGPGILTQGVCSDGKYSFRGGKQLALLS